MAEAAVGSSMSPLTLSRQRHWMLIERPGGTARRRSAAATTSRSTDWPARPATPIPTTSSSSTTFSPEQIDNNIGGYVADELLPLLARSRPASAASADGYAYSEQEIFERYVGAIVRSIDSNERRAWHRFYDNTLAALQASAAGRMTGARRQRFHRAASARSMPGSTSSSPRWPAAASSTWRRASASCRFASPAAAMASRRNARADHRLRSQPGAGGAGRGLSPAAAYSGRGLCPRRHPRR